MRGPANCPKEGIYALEGVVETDWTTSTFTMNWHLTRPGLTVPFEAGEPNCMITPQRRGDLEKVRPVVRDLSSEPEIEQGFLDFQASRSHFNERLRRHEANGVGWQRHYFQGRDLAGERHEQHQTRLRLRDFADETADADQPVGQVPRPESNPSA